MNRDNQNELIADVYRAKLVYEAEMKSPEYRAKGEEDFEFIGKALAAKGYCKASEVAREIIEEAEKIFMFTCSSMEAYTEWQNFKKKYTEGEKDEC